MMKRLAFVLLVAACDVTEPQAQRPIELWVYGQSNGVSPANDKTPVFSTTGHVWVNDYYCERPSGQYSCYFGTEMVQPLAGKTIRSNQTWMLLGDSLYRLTGRDVYIHQYASGGKITAQLHHDELFRHGKAALKAHPNICAALWIQGEAEVNIPVSQTVWFMKSIVDTTRAIHPGLPWFVALDAGGRPAQQQLIASGLVKQGPDIDALRSSNPELFDRGTRHEFEGEGHTVHARVWLDVLRQAKVCGL